ncbi:MAG: serine/threonine protein kinase [Deltaproteobacteria bacterium]|nr:serine/threonine protein kinase [Deltaproteobacteria bacterium]
MEEQARLGSLPRVGERVGRYEVLAEIAHGGMAAVYRVRLRGPGGFSRLFAMKVLLPHLSGDRNFVSMFLDEARIASAVRHANVVQVFELGEEPGLPYLVMELLQGHALGAVSHRARLADSVPPLGLWLEILAQAAEGLHAAHETRGPDGAPLGIVHRDVGPRNVHVGFDGIVKVVDFGIAAAKGRLAVTRTGTLKGTFRYLAPEQVIRDRPVDRRADIWSLGVVAWELLAGCRLFHGQDDAELLWNVIHGPIPALAPDLPGPVKSIVAACLERDPARRPPSCQEIAEALRDAARRSDFGPTGLRDEMRRLFGTDREPEDALEAGSPSAEGSDVVRIVSQRTTAILPARRSHLRRPVALGAAFVAMAAVAIGAARLLDAADQRAAGSREARLDRPQSTERPVAAPTPRTGSLVRIEVDPLARLVLVDGARHDERPIAVMLARGRRATLEIVSPTGEILSRTVGTEDDGSSIRLPPAPARQAPERPGRAAAGPRTGKKLLGNPY